jgi:hypothetical protein
MGELQYASAISTDCLKHPAPGCKSTAASKGNLANKVNDLETTPAAKAQGGLERKVKIRERCAADNDKVQTTGPSPSLRGAQRRGNPEGRTREKSWIASSQALLAMTPEIAVVNPCRRT